MNKPLMKYISHLLKPYQMSSLSANVSFSSKEYVHTIDFDYINALETFENNFFEVEFYLKETSTFYPYEQVYLQIRHAAFAYLFRIKKIHREDNWSKREFEMDLIDVKGENDELIELTYRYNPRRKRLPIEPNSFVSEKLRKFMGEYYQLPESLILYDLNLEGIIGDIHGPYAGDFYRNDYLQRKEEQEKWGNYDGF